MLIKRIKLEQESRENLRFRRRVTKNSLLTSVYGSGARRRSNVFYQEIAASLRSSQ